MGPVREVPGLLRCGAEAHPHLAGLRAGGLPLPGGAAGTPLRGDRPHVGGDPLPPRPAPPRGGDAGRAEGAGFEAGHRQQYGGPLSGVRRLEGVRYPGLFPGCDPVLRHRDAQARAGHLPCGHVPAAKRAGGVRLRGGHRVPGYHRLQAGRVRQGHPDLFPADQREGLRRQAGV